VLTISHFSKTYRGGKRAVDDLSLHIASGQIVGFIGHNGAGKSTTLKACAGVLPFEQGEIRIGAHAMKTDPIACKRQMAFVPDNPDLYEYLTGAQYLNFVSDLYRVGGAERRERIERYTGELEIDGALGDLISSYSHGMRQKLALCAAFVHEPRLLLLDEPFVGLDPKAAHTCKQLMRALCARGGAIFFSTHVLEVAQTLCDRVAIIQNGRLLVEGETQTVCRDESLESVFLELTEDA
jgi:ABC-2 type transport system ATP-binding protein